MKPNELLNKVVQGLSEDFSGIYMILFIAANKAYIGQSLNIRRRWVDHRNKLKHNSCNNPYLQNMYNKYGSAGIKFIVLENCSKEELSTKEGNWILDIDEELRLNIAGIGEFPEKKEHIVARTSPNLGRKCPEDIKKRISESLKGHSTSKDTREKLSKAGKLRKHSEESKNKMSKNMKGKIISEETRRKLSESVKRFHSKRKESMIEGGEKNEPKTNQEIN